MGCGLTDPTNANAIGARLSTWELDQGTTTFINGVRGEVNFLGLVACNAAQGILDAAGVINENHLMNQLAKRLLSASTPTVTVCAWDQPTRVIGDGLAFGRQGYFSLPGKANLWGAIGTPAGLVDETFA